MNDDKQVENQLVDLNQVKPTINQIEILELCGKGGMSLVFKARQQMLDRIVAVKVLSKEAITGTDSIKRFQKEAQLTSTLAHPNIVKTISCGISEDAQPYLVMEYLEGHSLAEILEREGSLQIQGFKDIFLPLLSALDHAHQAGLIHRDIKPSNILLCRSESAEEIVKLVDFGIVKVLGDGGQAQETTKTGRLIGSPCYMSPEQCQGKSLDARSDLYSLACVMYETLIGAPPFIGNSSLDVMQKHNTEALPTTKELIQKFDIDKELADAILWGLAKNPAQRPQAAAEFSRKLNEVFERITINKIPRPKKAAAPSLMNKWLFLGLGIGVVFTCVFLSSVTVREQLDRQKADKKVLLSSLKKLSKEDSLAKRESDLRKQLARQNASGANSLVIIKTIYELADVLIEGNKYPEAEVSYRSALVIAEQPTVPTLQLTESLELLASLCSRESKIMEAEQLYKRSLKIRETKFGPNDWEVAVGSYNLAKFYSEQKRTKEALPLFKQALRIEEQNPRGRDCFTDLDYTLTGLARSYHQMGEFKDAEELLKRALDRAEAFEGQDSNSVALILVEMGSCYFDQGKSVEAEPLFRRAVAIREKTYRPNEPYLSWYLAELGGSLVKQKKFGEAEQLYKRSLKLYETVPGNNKVIQAAFVKQLAECYRLQGREDKAITLMKRMSAH